MEKYKIIEIIKVWAVQVVIISILFITIILSFRNGIKSENRDPLFNQLIQGEQPMKVRTVPVSGDAVPHYHITWYDPVSELYYHSIEIPDH